MVKYALYQYSTENIGDEIQSIAARRFLPRVDYWINRDWVGNWHSPTGPDEPVKLIANGWYMRDPFQWPPTDASIDPLLVSMYVEPNGVGPNLTTPSDVFLTPESVEYLRKHGPVGARDYATLQFFQNHDIESYFSGCVTLTLQRDERIQLQDYVLAVDISDRLYEFLVKRTGRTIIRISPYGDFDLSERDRMTVAEQFLALYQSAAAVVTTRLHATLPSLALETPVLLIKEEGRYDPQRYAGLGELARNVYEDEYLADYLLFDLDNPPINPDRYLSLRETLIERCRAFTGYDNDASFAWCDPSTFMTNVELIETFADSFIKRHYLMESRCILERQRERIDTLERELDEQRRKSAWLKSEYDKVKTALPVFVCVGCGESRGA